jgi:hypothetical protein
MNDDALPPDGLFADLDSDLAAEPGASSTGIIQCLRMLADEAGSLHMHRTLAALRDAMQICTTEGARSLRAEAPGDGAAILAPLQARSRLH